MGFVDNVVHHPLEIVGLFPNRQLTIGPGAFIDNLTDGFDLIFRAQLHDLAIADPHHLATNSPLSPCHQIAFLER